MKIVILILAFLINTFNVEGSFESIYAKNSSYVWSAFFLYRWRRRTC